MKNCWSAVTSAPREPTARDLVKLYATAPSTWPCAGVAGVTGVAWLTGKTVDTADPADPVEEVAGIDIAPPPLLRTVKLVVALKLSVLITVMVEAPVAIDGAVTVI